MGEGGKVGARGTWSQGTRAYPFHSRRVSGGRATAGSRCLRRLARCSCLGGLCIDDDGRWAGYFPTPLRAPHPTSSTPFPSSPPADYPSDGIVTFSNINMECDGTAITPAWTTGHVDQACDFKANIIDSKTLSITWNPKAEDPSPELIAASQKNNKLGFAKSKEGQLKL